MRAVKKERKCVHIMYVVRSVFLCGVCIHMCVYVCMHSCVLATVSVCVVCNSNFASGRGRHQYTISMNHAS